MVRLLTVSIDTLEDITTLLLQYSEQAGGGYQDALLGICVIRSK